MNLKEAANLLGVHYQTAYKWVRAGELAAIRVGGRYEVSRAAVEQLVSRRAAVRREPPSVAEHEPCPTGLTPEDVLEELEAMATDPFVSTRAVADFATRRGAELTGDLCAVVCFAHDRGPALITVDHPSPAHAAWINGAIDTMGPVARTPGLGFPESAGQRLIRLSHVPQDVLREQIRPELRQHLVLNPIRSLLSVPIRVRGASCGVIAFVRGRPGCPHTDAEEAFALQMSTRIGSLVMTAADVEQALGVRRDLVAALALDLEHRPPGTEPSVAELAGLLAGSGADIGLPVAILDARLRFLAVNRAFREIRGRPDEDILGREFESVTDVDERASDRASFEPLATGELDYLDAKVRRVVPGGRELVYLSHRAAVRAADASLRYFVTVARPLRLPAADDNAIAAVAYRSPRTDRAGDVGVA